MGGTTNHLWFVPSILIVVGIVIFLITFNIDVAAHFHHIQLPTWIRSGIQNRAGKCSLPSLRRSSRWSVSSLHNDPRTHPGLSAVRSSNDAKFRS